MRTCMLGDMGLGNKKLGVSKNIGFLHKDQ